ncbi:MAG: TIGR00730 family Rossman fold protein [Candidatus Rokubacteria bacterium]|nr:TIGR00730 family Rossman fold protein [Candidatus Rokubacteria bacterium]MBI3826116.1 TIGR00730 family Rossman fold protein [Candidatus Rokubacteria bacterium]
MSRLCVFCGSSAGARPEYAETARDLGAALARRRLGLVYGGGSVGLMGVLADAVLAAGGEVIGVIPGPLATRELAHPGVTAMHVVGSMHERKTRMASLSDGFLALPGGLGTFEETLETLTWSQLGIHRKPVGVLNVLGYFDGLRVQLAHAVGEGFVRPEYAALLLFEERVPALLDAVLAWRPPALPGPWLRPGQT